MLPPASSPSDFEIIEYAPPAPILMFVVIDDIESPVQSVILFARTIIAIAPSRPALPTTQPKRKYIITPSIVSTSGVNTPPKVPNLEGFESSLNFERILLIINHIKNYKMTLIIT